MDYLFGKISMTLIAEIMVGIVAFFSLILLSLGALNLILVKMGLRNINRRRSQTVLILFGLMLSTLIITASLGVGDTFAYSLQATQFQQIGNLDEGVNKHNPQQLGTISDPYFTTTELNQAIVTAKKNLNVEAVTTALKTQGALKDETSNQANPQNILVAVPPDFGTVWGTLHNSTGQELHFNDLQQGEVFLGINLAHKLDAHVGDKTTLYLNEKTYAFKVRDIMDTEINSDITDRGPTVLTIVLPLTQVQQILQADGSVNQIFIKNRGTGGLDDLGAGNVKSENVTQDLRKNYVNMTSAQKLKDILSAAPIIAALKDVESKMGNDQPVKQDLHNFVADLANPIMSDRFISLVQQPLIQQQIIGVMSKVAIGQVQEVGKLESSLTGIYVHALKQDAVEFAQIGGSGAASILFLVSLFSIVVGVLLIFLIFVMLASERKMEMGMSRAVGMKRRHLTEMFVFEGAAYTIGAAFVGVLLGIGVGYLMVQVLASAIALDLPGFNFQHHITLRTLIIAFCMGMILTFIVVSISAYRVSRLNIVSAIREIEDNSRKDAGLVAMFLAIFRKPINGFKQLKKGHPFIFLSQSTFGVLASFWEFTWALFKRGPLTFLLAGSLLFFGVTLKIWFFYSTGVTLLIIGTGLLVRWLLGLFGLKQATVDRIGFSLMGGGLFFYWVAPFGQFEKLVNIYDRLDMVNFLGGPEVFFISAMSEVAGTIWLIMFNSDLLIKGVMFIANRVGRLAPIARTSMSYPLAFKFRTGVTVAMFAVVIYVIIFISVLNDVNAQRYNQPDKIAGGWQIVNREVLNQATDQKFPADLVAQIKADSKLNSQIDKVGTESLSFVTLHPVIEKQTTATDSFPLRVGDESYVANTTYKLQALANGYNSQQEVWKAFNEQAGLAILDASALDQGDNSMGITSIKAADKTFKPFNLELTDEQKQVHQLKVIGILEQGFRPATLISVATAQQLGLKTQPTGFYFRLKPGVDANQVRLALGSKFISSGFEPVILAEDIAQNNGITTILTRLLTAFLALGLVVGIAGLGVISSRAVVERRQQIGMLRALGYKRRLVQGSFLLESSFIAILGLAIGTGLAIWDSYTFVTQAGGNNGLKFHVPIPEIALILIGSYLATLVTTYFPARAAAKILPAEALRYE